MRQRKSAQAVCVGLWAGTTKLVLKPVVVASNPIGFAVHPQLTTFSANLRNLRTELVVVLMVTADQWNKHCTMLLVPQQTHPLTSHQRRRGAYTLVGYILYPITPLIWL